MYLFSNNISYNLCNNEEFKGKSGFYYLFLIRSPFMWIMLKQMPIRIKVFLGFDELVFLHDYFFFFFLIRVRTILTVSPFFSYYIIFIK